MLEDVFVKMLSKGKYYCSYKAVTVSLIAVSSKEVSPSIFFRKSWFPHFCLPPPLLEILSSYLLLIPLTTHNKVLSPFLKFQTFVVWMSI